MVFKMFLFPEKPKFPSFSALYIHIPYEQAFSKLNTNYFVKKKTQTKLKPCTSILHKYC